MSCSSATGSDVAVDAVRLLLWRLWQFGDVIQGVLNSLNGSQSNLVQVLLLVVGEVSKRCRLETIACSWLHQPKTIVPCTGLVPR